MAALTDVWACLCQVIALSFVSRSEAKTGWGGHGEGVVKVLAPDPNVLIFNESGSWQPDGQSTLRFTNVFRWTCLPDSIRLEHLRFGRNHPVYLFDLAPGADGIWREVIPHLCSDDHYSVSLQIKDLQLQLTWSIQGPRKRETIEYIYRWRQDRD